MAKDKAINFALFSLIAAVLDFALIVTILFMPIPLLGTLKVDRQRKIYLLGTFSLVLLYVPFLIPTLLSERKPKRPSNFLSRQLFADGFDGLAA